ncbi:MAG: TolC family protein [Verrucomicrobia bacterium]|nr:TolC family protein [Verrucomicrobiota bacterium]
MKLSKCLSASLLAAVCIAAPAADAPRALSLREAIQLALAKNPDLATAQHRIAAARAAIQQAEAAFWPRLRVGESYAGTDNAAQAFIMKMNQRDISLSPGVDFNSPAVTDNFNTKLLATYSLYDGGTREATRDAARSGVEARAQTFEAVRNDLVYEVTRAFHAIGKARRFLDAVEAAVKNMEANLKLATNRVEQGAALKTDALDADVWLAEARENRVRARSNLALAETIFRNALGVGESQDLTADASAGVADPASANTAAAGALDTAQRPEILAAQKAVAAAERQVRAARGGHRPRVNAFASYDVDGSSGGRFADSWMAGVNVEMDVFDGFLTRGKVSEARANLDAAREQLRRVELLVQLDAKQAQLNLGEARARLDTTARAVAQAEQSVQITRDRYTSGLTLLNQLLDSETALTAARQRRAAAEADCQIARAAMDKALGRTWKE